MTALAHELAGLIGPLHVGLRIRSRAQKTPLPATPLRPNGEAGEINAALSRRFKRRLMPREAGEVNCGPDLSLCERLTSDAIAVPAVVAP